MLNTRNISYLIQQDIDNVPGNSYQDKLNHLANCNCCERHQVNKPILFTAWHETPFHDYNNIHSCMCNCRHVARFICRQANGYINPPITRTNTPTSVLDI